MGRTCVFCASSELTADLRRLAADLGHALARDGDEVVYGGTMTGLMGEVAAATRAAGGRVVGVVPGSIAALGSVDDRLDELVRVDTLGERKVAMLRGVHRVVALAGGLGTLDELLEVLTMRQLGLVPEGLDVVVLDPTGHWDHLRAQLDVLVDRGAARPSAVRIRWVVDVAGVVGATDDGLPRHDVSRID
jgi:uncharacterized protein (TIGR00730 family)